MANKLPFGGWGKNPRTGQVERFWGDWGWTQGEDPTGGLGPKNPQQIQQADQQTRPQGSAQDLFSQYQQRLQPLQERASSLSGQLPTFAQTLKDKVKERGQYPSHAAIREELAQNPNLTPMAIEALVSRRGQSTRGTIADLINRSVGGLQAESQGANQAVQNLLQEYQMASQAQQQDYSRSGGSGGGTGLSIMDILGQGQGTPQQPTFSQEDGPQYSPARAGLKETVNGQEFVSDDKGNWLPAGGQQQGINRQSIMQAILQSSDPKQTSQLKGVLGLVPESGANQNINQMAQEALSGASLQELIQKYGDTFPVEEIIKMYTQLSKAGVETGGLTQEINDW